MRYRRIAFVSYAPFIPTQGGIQRVTDLLCRLLSAKGYKVFYFNIAKPTEEYDFPAPAAFCETEDTGDARNGGLYKRFLEENGIEVVINQDGQWETSRFFLNPEYVPAHVKTISVIHSVPTRECGRLGRWLWCRVRYGKYGMKERLLDAARLLLLPRTRKRRLCFFLSLYSFLKRVGTRVCMLSPYYVQEAREARLGIPEPLEAIPNPNTYRQEDVPAVPDKRKELLYVGRMEDGAKQVSLLLEVWERVSPSVPEWKLVLLGDGPDKAALERRAAKLKLSRIEFVGKQSPAPFYAKASILCMTSLFEGFPMVLTEAQQFGVVPIAFESFASVRSVIIPGGNGELAPPFSTGEYAQKLLHLMQDDAYRTRLAAKARETVRRFDPQRIAETWDELIQSL